MANRGTAENKKLALLRILQIIQKHSDYEHPITQKEIAEKLYDNYGIDMERKAIGRNINLLREAGFDIPAYGRGTYLQGSESEAQMPGFDFEESELRLLIDSVLSSNHISGKEADVLVGKLSKMGNKFFANTTKEIKKSYAIARVDTAELFYNIGAICKAISNNKKIKFTELRYTSDMKLHEWRGSQSVMSPFNIVASQGNYYLIGIADGQNFFSAFRLERLHKVTETNDDRASLNGKMREELDNFIGSHPLMTGGHVTKAIMLVNKSILGDLVDSFGTNFEIKKKLKKEYYVEVEAAEEELESWAFRYADNVEILSPEAIRDNIRDKTQRMAARYVNWKPEDRYKRRVNGRPLHVFNNINLRGETEYQNLTDARTLYFEHNNLTDFSFLKNYSTLRGLSIINNPVEFLPFNAETSKTSLTSFELSDTAIKDISFMNKMPEIRRLMLGYNPIKDYTPLYGLKKLRKLLIVEDIAETIDLEKIRENNPDVIIKIVPEFPKLFDRITNRIW